MQIVNDYLHIHPAPFIVRALFRIKDDHIQMCSLLTLALLHNTFFLLFSYVWLANAKAFREHCKQKSPQAF